MYFSAVVFGDKLLIGVLQPYLKIDCGLGEAPFWERSSHQLRFVDIVKQKLHVIDLNKGPSSLKSFDLDVPVGWVLNLYPINLLSIVVLTSGIGVPPPISKALMMKLSSAPSMDMLF